MVNATVTGVVYSDNKLAIYRVDKVLLPLDFFVTKAPASAPVVAKAPKAEKENSSEEDHDDGTTLDKNDSGAVSLISIQGTTLMMSFGVALVAVTMIWN